MKNKILTVSVGIPAYNEKANIQFLLKSLLVQKLKHTKLTKIVVISDGSTDKTLNKAKSVKDKRILVIDRKKRLGMSATQNEILKYIKSDVLVLLDADVIPADKFFIENMVKPLLKDEAVGLVGACTVTAQPQSFIESIITFSHSLKIYLYKNFKGGDNIYLCHGAARAFSKKLYKRIEWEENCPEDSYSYLFCLSQRLKFRYEPNAKVVFRSPNTIYDYAKQSLRFYDGRKSLENYFSKDLVKREFNIPRELFLIGGALFFIKNPLLLTGFLLINIFIRKFIRIGKIHHSLHQVSETTKKVVHQI